MKIINNQNLYNKSSFIPPNHRPEVRGGRISKLHDNSTQLIKSRFNELPIENTKVICIGPERDFVLSLLKKENNESLEFCYYEGINRSWIPIFEDGLIKFITKNSIIIPKKIYLRGVVFDSLEGVFSEISEFFEILDICNTEVIGRPKTQIYNESKLYQYTQSMYSAAKNIGSIQFPEAFVVKGDHTLIPKENYIVKSLSGVRSLVVSSDVYNNWDKKRIDVPVMFQKKIDGSDLRCHYLNGKTWGILVQDKSEVDYRYATARSEMKEFKMPYEVTKFMDSISKVEGGTLIGFDYLYKDGIFYPLEANPGPGWAWYHENEVCEKSFIKEFMNYLTQNCT